MLNLPVGKGPADHGCPCPNAWKWFNRVDWPCQAGVHPLTKFTALDDAARAGLHECLVHVLDQGVAANGEPERMPDDFLLHRRRRGASCPRCGGSVENIRAAGRSAWLCPQCQPPP